MARWVCRTAAVTVAALLLLLGVTPPAHAQEINLPGKWSCDDDGTYYLRQVGRTVWWLGKSQNDGQAWTNVFRGTIKDRRIVGDWADVPQGGNSGMGVLTLELIIRDGQVVEIRKGRQLGDGFGGGVWRRQD